MFGTFVRVAALACTVALAMPCASIAADAHAPDVVRTADSAIPVAGTSIPFELVDNHVVLDVTIDGKGPFRFAFDTGGANVIDAAVAEQIGLRVTGNAYGTGVGEAREPIRFARVDELRVGDAALHNQRFVVGAVHDGFGRSSGKPIDGLIGYEVLAHFRATFDYAGARVVLRPPGNDEPAASADARTIPIALRGHHPVVACTIGGIATSCLIDTGSRLALTVLSPFIAQHPAIVPANATAPGADGFGIGGPAMGRLARVPFEIGGFALGDVVADLSTQTRGAFADPSHGGNVGGDVLKRFTVGFDYAHRTMTLAPNARFAQREPFDRSGAFLIAQAGAIVIADVRPGTPAASAGLAGGDTLASVDGSDAAALGLAGVRDAFRGAPGTVLRLTVASKNGAVRTVTLTLADYV